MRFLSGARTGIVLLGAAVGGGSVSSSVSAGTLEGRVVVEMEYLGESYFSEHTLSAADLGLTGDTPLLLSDTTRFNGDSWLPGQRLELRWLRQNSTGTNLDLSSRTAFNQDRFSQDVEFRAEIPGQSRGRWLFLVNGVLREEERSLVGHGDWRANVEAVREVPFAGSLKGRLGMGWQHSRTRGDSVSYLYDYDLLRARATLSGGGSWLPAWDVFVEGRVKAVPRGEPGGYREARVASAWRPNPGVRSFRLDLRIRDYEQDQAVGRDVWSAELNANQRLLGDESSAWTLEGQALMADYRGVDELYYDAAEVVLHLPWRNRVRGWDTALGPAGRFLWDTSGGARDFQQWTGRGSAGRILGIAGFGEVSVEAGYRDYRDETADVIEVSSLSSSILRSDYWLVDLLALLNVPVWGSLSLDLIGSTSWEIHTRESERIQITFVTLGFSRAF